MRHMLPVDKLLRLKILTLAKELTGRKKYFKKHLFNTINASPVASPRNADGSYSYLEDVTEVINPLAQIANTFNQTNINKLVGKEEINYKINSHFDVTGRLGYNYALVDDKTFNPLV